MKKIVLLHGWEASTDAHWFPWLKQQAEKKGYEVLIPELSDPVFPILDDQLSDLEHISLQSGDIVVGHSLGCQLALKWVEQYEYSDIQVICVAPSYPNLADELGDDLLGEAFECLFNYYNTPLNFRILGGLRNSYTVMLSDDDPYINEFNAQQYYKQLLGVYIRHFQNKGHFNTSAGVLELPEILDLIAE